MYTHLFPQLRNVEESPEINVRSFSELVVCAACESPAGTVVDVVAQVDRVVVRNRQTTLGRWRIVCDGVNGRRRLDIVNAPTIPVIGGAEENPELFLCAETLADSTAELVDTTTANDRRVSA